MLALPRLMKGAPETNLDGCSYAAVQKGVVRCITQDQYVASLAAQDIFIVGVVATIGILAVLFGGATLRQISRTTSTREIT